MRWMLSQIVLALGFIATSYYLGAYGHVTSAILCLFAGLVLVCGGALNRYFGPPRGRQLLQTWAAHTEATFRYMNTAGTCAITDEGCELVVCPQGSPKAMRIDSEEIRAILADERAGRFMVKIELDSLEFPFVTINFGFDARGCELWKARLESWWRNPRHDDVPAQAVRD